MAFLCPVRIRSSSNGTRKKKQAEKKRSFLATVNSIIGDSESVANANDNNNVSAGSNIAGSAPTGPGRITGSSSIETLVRVGLEKEAGIPPEARNMVVLHDFTPCVDDELEVRRGSVVSILYRENDWVYVILEQLPNGTPCNVDDGHREGFIPHSYCAPYGSPLAEMALCSTKGGAVGRINDRGGGTDGGGRIDSQGDAQHRTFDDSGSSVTTTVPFYKDPSPTRYIALYKFTARDENDVNVERGEILTVLNKDDPDWFYVSRSDGQEGFVPSAFVYPFSPQQEQQTQSSGSTSSQQLQQPTYQQISEVNEYADDASNLQQQSSPKTAASGSDFNSQSPTAGSPHLQYGTELVMLYDYKAQAPDDLSVRRGDWVYADLLHQTVEGWLWAYAPKQRKYGFIPKAYARPPCMTSL